MKRDFAIPSGLYLGFKVCEIPNEAISAVAVEDVTGEIRDAVLAEIRYRAQHNGRASSGIDARRYNWPPSNFGSMVEVFA